jgi:hypothetical protein
MRNIFIELIEFIEVTRGVFVRCCGCQRKSDVIQMIIDETLSSM